jgi:hypothetical protein
VELEDIPFIFTMVYLNMQRQDLALPQRRPKERRTGDFGYGGVGVAV